jgi:antitoxin CptB
MPNRADSDYARLRWRCRRGMRELDAVLNAFLRNSFAALGDEDKSRFAAILDLPDPELYAYLAGRAAPDDQDTAALIERIRASLHPRT